MRQISWVALFAAPVIALIGYAVYEDDIAEAEELLSRIDEAEPASLEELFRGDRREGPVKLEGVAGAREPLPFPTQPARKVAHYQIDVWHRYTDDDDNTETVLEERLRKTALEITRGSDLFVAVEGQPTYAYLKHRGGGDAEIVETAEGYAARYGALAVAFTREGGDELWVEEEWLEPGEPVFAVGELVRRGGEVKLLGAPDGWLLLSVHGGEETRAMIAEARVTDERSYNFVLGLAGVLFLLGLAGVIFASRY